MRLRPLVLAGSAAALALPPFAAAGGPTSAAISGPGLPGPVQIPGNAKTGSYTPLGETVAYGGFYPLVFRQSPDPTLRARPAGELGPVYRIVFAVPDPGGPVHHLTQLVYPYARPYPVTYVRPRQRVWFGQRAQGGWFRAPAELKAALVRVGLPATRPRGGGFWWSPGSYAVTAASVVALAVLAWAAFVPRRRARSRP